MGPPQQLHLDPFTSTALSTGNTEREPAAPRAVFRALFFVFPRDFQVGKDAVAKGVSTQQCPPSRQPPQPGLAPYLTGRAGGEGQ